jgi:gliding motility-associated lipoprotein GldH
MNRMIFLFFSSQPGHHKIKKLKKNNLMKKMVLMTIGLLLLISCSRGKIFERYEDIDKNKWAYDKIVTFEVNVEDTVSLYDVELAIRHASFYPFANLKLNLTTIYPNGEERTKDHDLMLRNKDGSFKAEGAGDLWDITFPLLEKASFNLKGKYLFKIQNIMPLTETEGVMQVGLIVKKSKQ